ncbi:hypothetical protein [Vibrio coralliirubri]|uniref:hypothetical protein n=1 Tax=Vibrio coralliirubri TaxID=1516159 RepID=UPI000A3C44A5|nr:hypothetical protein [Vibrio coralliirubri]
MLNVQRTNTNVSEFKNTDTNRVLSSAKGISLSDAKKQVLTSAKMFEAGVSMNILNQPSSAGTQIDNHAKSLSDVLKKISSDGTNHTVVFNNKEMPLTELFEKQFSPMSSNSDQIGRQPKESKEPLKNWLIRELNIPTGEKNHASMLTKIKAISTFGTTVWQLLNPPEGNAHKDFSKNQKKNSDALSSILGKDVFPLFKEFSQKTRTKVFDDSLTRARSERMPMIRDENGVLKAVDGKYEDAAKYGLGFGQVVQKVNDEKSLEQHKLLDALNGNKNINGIPRENAPIQDLTRPYMMSESEMASMPQSYKNLGLSDGMTRHKLHHGTGINRWQPYGMHALESSYKGKPYAGAQSGGTCDILLAATILSGESMYGKTDKVMPLTLGAAAFMNYGGYHTFNEVVPIGEAMSHGKPFVPSNKSALQKSDLYDRVQAHTKKHLKPMTFNVISSYKNVHNDIVDQLKQEHKSLSLDINDLSDTIYYTK